MPMALHYKASVVPAPTYRSNEEAKGYMAPVANFEYFPTHSKKAKDYNKVIINGI